jgi:hypothetical protein
MTDIYMMSNGHTSAAVDNLPDSCAADVLKAKRDYYLRFGWIVDYQPSAMRLKITSKNPLQSGVEFWCGAITTAEAVRRYKESLDQYKESRKRA